jgi:hypothetical protein
MGAKKRPITASRRNQGQFGIKKSFGAKNPSTLELEQNRMRPRIINQEREKLYDENQKNKKTANFLKEENMKLKTRIHFMENEMAKNEKLVSELMQQESYSGPGGGKIGVNKLKMESHLTLNLKRKIKEIQ